MDTLRRDIADAISRADAGVPLEARGQLVQAALHHAAERVLSLLQSRDLLVAADVSPAPPAALPE